MKLKSMLAAAAIACAAATPTLAGVYATPGDTSAYVSDWALGPAYENFAFLISDSSFVGSWTVDQGPSWTTVPTAYSGLTAAALLFGGSPTDYFLSTIGNVAGSADHLAWVSTWGGACDGQFPCGTKVDEGFVKGTVPEPASWALMVAGFGAVGLTVRRRRTTAVAA